VELDNSKSGTALLSAGMADNDPADQSGFVSDNEIGLSNSKIPVPFRIVESFSYSKKDLS
jgi:hypothetical protein